MGRLLLLFVALPAIELALLIEIGQRIGTLETLALIVVTGVVGASMARSQGLRVTNEQPVWNILWSNLKDFRINWGGERWFFDNTGGANGIGQLSRAGLTQFDAWVVPTAVQTAQWNGDVDALDGAFSLENGPFNDFGLGFRVLDLDSAFDHAYIGTLLPAIVDAAAFKADTAGGIGLVDPDQVIGRWIDKNVPAMDHTIFEPD